MPNIPSTSCTGHGLTGESKMLFDNKQPGQEMPQLCITAALLNTLPHEDQMETQE